MTNIWLTLSIRLISFLSMVFLIAACLSPWATVDSYWKNSEGSFHQYRATYYVGKFERMNPSGGYDVLIYSSYCEGYAPITCETLLIVSPCITTALCSSIAALISVVVYFMIPQNQTGCSAKLQKVLKACSWISFLILAIATFFSIYAWYAVNWEFLDEKDSVRDGKFHSGAGIYCALTSLILSVLCMVALLKHRIELRKQEAERNVIAPLYLSSPRTSFEYYHPTAVAAQALALQEHTVNYYRQKKYEESLNK